jgi:DNA/RNA-binding domain of Phe-tRNA-synthetase-like protein
MIEDLEPELGWIDAELQGEFPELRLYSVAFDGRSGRSTRAVRERLRLLSNRFHGIHAIVLRQDPVPGAYRAFFRQIGFDPDTHRTPIEAAALDRLMAGGFPSRNLLDDALLIALVETGVPIWAFDAERVDGPLGVRAALSGERLGRDTEAPSLLPGRLVVADAGGPLAVLFGDLAPGHGVGDATRRMVLFALQVAGVPQVHVEEALWMCSSVLALE